MNTRLIFTKSNEFKARHELHFQLINIVHQEYLYPISPRRAILLSIEKLSGGSTLELHKNQKKITCLISPCIFFQNPTTYIYTDYYILLGN